MSPPVGQPPPGNSPSRTANPLGTAAAREKAAPPRQTAAVKGPVTTIEGLGTLDKLHPLQRAFIEEQACQCGYCGNGMVMSAKALLERNPAPTASQIRQALNGHLCRCASHNRIVRAVQRAAKEMRS